MRRVVLVVGLFACNSSKPQPAAAPPPEIPTGSNVGVATPHHDDTPKVAPAKQVAWQLPARAASDQEHLLAGTWVAKVGDYASRSAVMGDKVMLALDPKNPDLVSNVTEAIEKDNKIASNCIWLELRDDHTGFRRECAIVGGEPSALDQNDLATGQKKDFGTKLEWFIDDKDKNKLKIHFADDMIVPARRDGKLVMLVFRTWWLQVDKADKAAGDNNFFVKEWFPEHDYALPTEYTYFIASGQYLH